MEKQNLKQESKVIRFEEKILKLISSGEKRKASNQIEKFLEEKNVINNKEVLSFILEPSGMTVAHKMAFLGCTFQDEEILKLRGEDRSKENALYGHNGCSVAFILAKKGQTFVNPEILCLGSELKRSSVAHAMAAKGYKFSDMSILSLADDKGNTVAHVMATAGYQFQDEKILDLKNNFGFSVRDFQVEQQSSPSLNM